MTISHSSEGGHPWTIVNPARRMCHQERNGKECQCGDKCLAHVSGLEEMGFIARAYDGDDYIPGWNRVGKGEARETDAKVRDIGDYPADRRCRQCARFFRWWDMNGDVVYGCKAKAGPGVPMGFEDFCVADFVPRKTPPLKGNRPLPPVGQPEW